MLAYTLLASSCTQVSTSQEASPPTPSDDAGWQVTVTMSGGFAGLAEQFIADYSNATLQATDQARGVSNTRTLTTAELRELSDLLGTRPLQLKITRRNPECADCIHYEISIRRDTDVYEASYDSSTLSGSTDDEALIQRIIELGRRPVVDSTKNTKKKGISIHAEHAQAAPRASDILWARARRTHDGFGSECSVTESHISG